MRVRVAAQHARMEARRAPTAGNDVMRAFAPLLCALMGALTLPAQALPTATLTARTSVNHLYYFGGFATIVDEGEDGAPVPTPGGDWDGAPMTVLSPLSLMIAGSHFTELNYISWHGFVSETWDQAQSYSFGQEGADAVLAVQGHAAIEQVSQVCSEFAGCILASELHTSTNTLALEFSLDDITPYTLTGSTRGEQWIDLMRWDEIGQQWNAVVSGLGATQDRAFSLDGSLVAGSYLLRNNPYPFSAGGPADVDNAWTARLTLTGAVAAVPEPGAAMLLLAGLGLLGSLTRRRRIGGQTVVDSEPLPRLPT